MVQPMIFCICVGKTGKIDLPKPEAQSTPAHLPLQDRDSEYQETENTLTGLRASLKWGVAGPFPSFTKAATINA